MSKSEIFDVVDEEGNVIGQATREECHSNPSLIHQVVHSWIFNSQGQVLLQKRSLKKDSNPGVWDMSCGGHFGQGESKEQCLVREMKEELGLEDLAFSFVSRKVFTNEKQSEMVYLYYTIKNLNIEDINFDKEEIDEVVWYDISDVQKRVLNRDIDFKIWILMELGEIFQYILKNGFDRKITRD